MEYPSRVASTKTRTGSVKTQNSSGATTAKPALLAPMLQVVESREGIRHERLSGAPAFNQKFQADRIAIGEHIFRCAAIASSSTGFCRTTGAGSRLNQCKRLMCC